MIKLNGVEVEFTKFPNNEHGLYFLKDKINMRSGKLIYRPDSGDPVKIICGDPDSDNPNAKKGVVEILWDIFGGTVNTKGFKELDMHIGCIYGDAIKLERCEEICKRLADKGFASTNMVYGIGSFTYQYNTRDTFGFALKSTYCEINGKAYNLFKNPVTDIGSIKKSQHGKVCVNEINGKLEWFDSDCMCDYNAQEWCDLWKNNFLKPIFHNGNLMKETTLSEIRNRM